MFKRSIVALLATIVLISCDEEPKDTRPGQPVAHRRAAFKEVLRTFEPMGVMLRTDVYDPEKFQALVGEFMSRRNSPWDYFGADTLYPPSHAKADVWTEAAKFAIDRNAFLLATDKLSAIAGTPDKNVAEAAYFAVEKSCKNCHDAFRSR